MSDASALTDAWRKSSYSENASGGCVEVADGFGSVMPVRDSKVPEGPAVVFPADSWKRFVAAVVDGETLP
ncbi:DUF397 domain-containing protein [Streptomyces hoynatensis]|uniref:DUF397 domain-containing protein n=1 Tax=Streptomyces hoynatensis TaxID=1141874 RepID=A0A3A9YU98_9ACTN|nr:DUF397 domain-containing protein [Streptomyces hoynatensis]